MEPYHQPTQQGEHDGRFENCLAGGISIGQADSQRCQCINRAEQPQPEADGGQGHIIQGRAELNDNHGNAKRPGCLPTFIQAQVQGPQGNQAASQEECRG